MTQALERARMAVSLHSVKETREKLLQDKARQLFTSFVTWFDAQPAGSLEQITDFPNYPRCLGVRLSDGPARWTIAKEPAMKELPNPPVIFYFEYRGEEGNMESPHQFSESYLLYRDHIESGDANGQKLYHQGVFIELKDLLNKMIETHPAETPAQGKE